MANDSPLQEKLIGVLAETHAMAVHFREALSIHHGLSGWNPEVEERLERHLAETDEQIARLERCLAAHDREPSTLRRMLGNALGMLQGFADAYREDTYEHMMTANYVAKHLAIANYVMLRDLARAVGDDATRAAMESSMMEEMAMARWLFERLPQASFVSARHEGFEVPEDLVDSTLRGDRWSLEFSRAGVPAD